MKPHDNTPQLGRELRDEDLRQAGGGYSGDDIPYCGTVPRRFPPRPPGGFGGGIVINPVVLAGGFTAR